MTPKQKQKRIQEITDAYVMKVHELTETYQQKIRSILKAIDKDRLERLKKELAS